MSTHLDRPDLTISLPDGPCTQRIQTLIHEALERRQFGQDYYEFKDLLIVTPFKWPALAEWAEKFQSMSYLPRTWPWSVDLDIPEEYGSGLARLQAFSADVRAVLLKQPYPMSRSAFLQKFGDQTLEHLTALGFIKLVTGPCEKLQHLPLEYLRGIQKKLGIKGGASRIQKAEKIKGAATEEVLAGLLPLKYQEAIVLVVAPLCGVAPDWIARRGLIAQLYLTTVFSFMNTLRQIAAGEQLGSGVVLLERGSICPVCVQHHGVKIVLGVSPLPPFHPGCMCDLTLECISRRLDLAAGH